MTKDNALKGAQLVEDRDRADRILRSLIEARKNPSYKEPHLRDYVAFSDMWKQITTPYEGEPVIMPHATITLLANIAQDALHKRIKTIEGELAAL